MDIKGKRWAFGLCLVSIFFSLFLSQSALATENYAEFDIKQGRLDLSPYIEVLLPNKDGRLPDRDSNNYIPLSNISNNIGFYGASAIWIRFSVRYLNAYQYLSECIYLELESPIIDHITLYTPQKGGEFNIIQTGDLHPLSTRTIEFRNFLFKLPETEDKIATYYIKIESKGTIQLPLYLWSEERLIEHIDQNSMLLGCYFGFLFFLLLMACVAYVHFRQKVLLNYIGYLIANFLLQFSLNGLSFQYLWPSYPEYSGRLNSGLVGISIICGVLFCIEYLQINRKKYPRLIPYIYGFICVVIAGCLLVVQGAIGVGTIILIICGMLLLPSIIIISYCAYQNGVKRAKYFLFAWLFLLVAVFIAGLHYLGLIPYSHVTFYAMPVGSLIEVTILCFVTIYHMGELKREKDYLSEQATHDGMTGLLNHSTVKSFLQQAKKRATETKEDLAIILIDIDNFKHINDTLGHLVGDDVIRNIASIIKLNVRASDYCGRYGGDEFLLILPGANRDIANRISENIRIQISSISLLSEHDYQLSVSIGISTLCEDNNMINEADIAMYQSKEQGKNRTNIYQEIAD